MSENDPLELTLPPSFLLNMDEGAIRAMIREEATQGALAGLKPYASLKIGGKALLGTPEEMAKEVQARLDILSKHECYYKPTAQKGLWAAAGMVLGAGGMYLATQKGWVGKGAEAPATQNVDSYGNVVNL